MGAEFIENDPRFLQSPSAVDALDEREEPEFIPDDPRFVRRPQPVVEAPAPAKKKQTRPAKKTARRKETAAEPANAAAAAALGQASAKTQPTTEN